MELGVLDILKLAGFELAPRCRFFRHQIRRYPITELRREGLIDVYQSYQSKPVLDRVDQLVSFYALPGTRAAFYGVYEVGKRRSGRKGDTIPGQALTEEWNKKARYFYELREDKRFADFRDRLVIEWGRGTLAWVQKASNKPIVEIREAGRRLPPFEDYLEFSLSFRQLQDLFAYESAHREWRSRLSAVAGVYLVLAEKSGDQYVGSASGEGGVWGRWRQYAKSGHGGNAQLKELLRTNAAYPDGLRFSILQILPKTLARSEVIKREGIYKAKLGTRATGLNSN